MFCYVSAGQPLLATSTPYRHARVKKNALTNLDGLVTPEEYIEDDS